MMSVDPDSVPMTTTRKIMRKTHDEGSEGFVAVFIAVDDAHCAASACTRRRVKKPNGCVRIRVEDRDGLDRGGDVRSIQVGPKSRVEAVGIRREEAGLGEGGLGCGVVSIRDCRQTKKKCYVRGTAKFSFRCTRTVEENDVSHSSSDSLRREGGSVVAIRSISHLNENVRRVRKGCCRLNRLSAQGLTSILATHENEECRSHWSWRLWMAMKAGEGGRMCT